MKSTVEVDREALRIILSAITSEQSYRIRELQATMKLPDSPITKVINDFNSSVAYQTITQGLFGDADE